MNEHQQTIRAHRARAEAEDVTEMPTQEAVPSQQPQKGQ